MRRLAGIALVSALSTLSGAARGQPSSRYAISIYNSASSNADALFTPVDGEAGAPGGYAVVRDRRQFELKPGTQTLQARDVARWLDASALNVHAIDAPDGVEIVSQRFNDESLSLDALVQNHFGHAVEIVSGTGANTLVTTGTLLSNVGGLSVLLADGRVATVTESTRITFPDLPKTLSATPTLRWDVAAKKAGPQAFEIVYPTQGLGWRAEYSAWLAPGTDCKMDFSAWAQIANRSGTSFADARLKLIAGEPHRVQQVVRPRPMMAKAMAAQATMAIDSGNAGDYHEYTLDAAVDLGGGLLRVALFPETTLPCQRQYLFEGTGLRVNSGMAPITDRNYGLGEHEPVRSTLTVRVDRALPAGRIRVIENASDGAPEFVGEDQLGHTPRNEPIGVNLGDAFDMRGERAQTDFQIDKDKHTLSESFAVHLVNRGGHAQSVTVREHLYRWTQWNIVQNSTKFEKRNADTVDFKIDVPANGDARVSYTVQYQWTESLR
jgi:hypothetical protein